MQLSNRIMTLTGDEGDGWDLFFKSKQMIDAGKDVIELTIGEHDIGTDPVILEAMDRAARGGHTGYASVPGIPSLRETIAARITERTGVKTGPDNIQITTGGQAALFAAHLVCCDDGDKALFIDPYYATYPGTIRGAGAVPVPIAARSRNGFQPEPADIAAQAGDAVSLLINSPNNPTGVVYTRETMEGIAKVCRDHDLWLISDEVYDTQIWEGEHISPRALPGMEERTLVIGSMSKSHAMTGSRIGWIVGEEETIAHITNLATHTTYGVPGFVQDAAEFALKAGPELEARIAAPFLRRREIAQRLLQGNNAVRLIPAGGAMYVMLDIRATGMSGDDFANALLDQELIATMPGESFGAAAAGHLRVALTIDDERFEEAFARLLKFAEQQIT